MLTTEKFIKKAKEIHNNKYKYDKVIYTKTDEEVKIFCTSCGQYFFQKPTYHLQGSGCRSCADRKRGISRRNTLEQFIKKCQKKHGSRFDYSEVELTTGDKKVKIFCNTCKKYFLQQASNHLSGFGCPHCARDSLTKKLSLTKEEFIQRSSKTHSNKYNYSKVELINSKSRVKIICPKHGEFKQDASNHLDGNGCRKCASEAHSKRMSHNLEIFLSKAKKVHLDRYDYSKSIYTNNRIKIEIICPEHGSFWQDPQHHLEGSGCPLCNSSKGEREIERWLKKYNITYTRQKIFSDCKNINLLPFDFYLPEYNTLIEFDGEQHFHEVSFGSGKDFAKKEFLARKQNDLIKTTYAEKKQIKLLRISYKDNIHDKLLGLIKFF